MRRRMIRRFIISGLTVFVFLTFAAFAMAQGADDAIPETGMSDLDMWNLVAGFLMPLALSVIIQSGWSRAVQSVLAFAACLGMALVTTSLEGNLDFRNWVTSALTVLVATIIAYQGVWKPTGVAPAIEKATNVTPKQT